MNKEVAIDYTNKIEDFNDATHVDFANKYIGGGSFNTGSVQEEILFLIYPELYASTLFFEVMDNNEAIFMGNV